jgi:hypothetical protein
MPVGQYWLIIKINGTNSVNFVGNSVNFVGNSVNFVGNMLSIIGIFRNHSSLPPSTTILESFSGKFFLTTRAQSEKVGQIYFRTPNFFLPVRPCKLVLSLLKKFCKPYEKLRTLLSSRSILTRVIINQ